MKKPFLSFCAFLCFQAFMPFSQESAPPVPAQAPAPSITPCMPKQKWTDKIIRTANSFDKPSLKNPAIEKQVLKAMEYVRACNLEHALKTWMYWMPS